MPANIRTFAERGGNAWHGLGKRLEGVDGRVTSALDVAEADFPVTTVPLWTTWNGERLDTNNVAIIRPPLAGETEPVILGTATKEYRPITNREIAELLDPLTDQWPTETVGVLGKGEQFFVTLNAGTADIAGDEMRLYYFVWNSHDGSGKLRFRFTPVRVVCQNTCILGDQRATVGIDVVHTQRVHVEAAFASRFLITLQQAQSRSLSTLSAFPRIRVPAEQVTALLRAVYPDVPENPRLLALESAEQEVAARGENPETVLDADTLASLAKVRLNRESALKQATDYRLQAVRTLVDYDALAHDRDASLPTRLTTGWALYQTITDVESWREGGTDQSRAKQILLNGPRGQRMATAYDLLTKLAVEQDVLEPVGTD